MNETATPPTADVNRHTTSFLKSALAGAVAGLVGTGVKTLCELIAPPRAPGVLSPLGNGINAVSNFFAGGPMADAPLHTTEMVVHWAFGIAIGVVYAVVAEWKPVVTVGYGLAFGLAFWVLAHETVLPLIGWSPTPLEMTLWEQGNELVTHCLFGVVVELARRALRPRL